ncbi:hypothetical protein, partial [Salmonella sp. gx-f7]|uniref:hypothetical protein n=1 Tax=Salmonella sp. gx-f7 TaxID=2582606 RepID=UPI001F1AE034
WRTILAAILMALFSCHHLSISAKKEGIGVTSSVCSFWMDVDYRDGVREWCWPGIVSGLIGRGPVWTPSFLCLVGGIQNQEVGLF